MTTHREDDQALHYWVPVGSSANRCLAANSSCQHQYNVNLFLEVEPLLALDL